MVYNPAGAFFPPDQTAMELEYKEHLEADFGIVFNALYTLITIQWDDLEHFSEDPGIFQGI